MTKANPFAESRPLLTLFAHRVTRTFFTVLAVATLVLTGGLTHLGQVPVVFAGTAWAPWVPNWNYGSGFNDLNDYSCNTSFSASNCGEYGIDVPLALATPIYTPQSGRVIAYQPGNPSSPCFSWWPGRLLVKLSGGAVVGFGHVNQVASVGSAVKGGQEIATVGSYSACVGNESDNHVEFMYDSSANGGPGYYPQQYFLPSTPVSPTSGCPRQAWTVSGGTSVDPCAVLKSFMHGVAPSSATTPPVTSSPQLVPTADGHIQDFAVTSGVVRETWYSPIDGSIGGWVQSPSMGLAAVGNPAVVARAGQGGICVFVLGGGGGNRR